MTIAEAIERTKNKKGMRVSIRGICSRISGGRGAIGRADKFMLSEFGKNFGLAKQTWLEGDLEAVAEFFGLYQ